MPRSSPDLHCATLIRDYLVYDSELDVTADVPARVPDATVLPKVIMDSGEQRKVPCLAINAAETGDSSGARRTVEVALLMPYLLRNQDADAPTDAVSQAQTLTRATASQRMDIIECRLRDDAAFNTWLATLSESDREGWSILRRRVRQQPAIQREKDQPAAAQTLSLGVEFVLAWAR